MEGQDVHSCSATRRPFECYAAVVNYLVSELALAMLVLVRLILQDLDTLTATALGL